MCGSDIMKKMFIISIICFPLLIGCKNVDATRSSAVPVAGNSQTSGPAQIPDYAGLVDEYRRMLREDPNNLAVIIALGNAYFNKRSWSNAVRWYDQALKIDPRYPDVHANMGTAYRYMGRPDRALAEYRLALKSDPGNADAHYNMGAIYAFDMNRHDLAIRIWEDLLQREPNYPLAGDIRSYLEAFRKELKRGGS